jgi:Peptidase M10 serralysin C terminal/RTX calcium-binding nonapeptide repeat (4 copies)
LRDIQARLPLSVNSIEEPVMTATPMINAGAAAVPSSRDGFVSAFSLDPQAGGTANGKPIFTLEEVVANANRTGFSWNLNNAGALDDGVLTFSFFNSQDDFAGTGYINEAEDTAFDEYFNFEAFTPEQRDAARESLGLWDDLVNISFVETENVQAGDIRFGNTDTGGAQAYAYLPFGDIFNDPVGSGGFSNLGDLGGDVWVDKNVPSNFFPLAPSYYSILTLVHEIGHSLGLSHPGDYNALDDNDGDGEPDPITYANDAFFAQDSGQYSVMSYFDAFETGAQHIDWSLMNFAYASTPLVHDIAAIQAIYGADPTTRTGNTIYGFNSTADRDVYDFNINTRPILAIYDAGGTDTLDFSGWNTPSVIDLNPGSFSSGGGVEAFLTLAQINANRAAAGLPLRTQAIYDLYLELFAGPQGLTNGLYKDNISIAYGTIIENATGGGGNDMIIANQVANILNGGSGRDTVSYETATSGVIVSIGNRYTGSGGALGDRLISIENLKGSAFDDKLIGDGGNNVIDGGSGGRDVLDGGRGIDTVSFAGTASGVVINLDSTRGGGGATGDVIRGFENIIGTAFDDDLRGNQGDNVIDGGAGNDRISGGPGNDILNAGTGADVLTGGRGQDAFVFSDDDAAADRIIDFNHLDDTIDLSGIDANINTDANDAFSFIGNTAFSGIAGELRYNAGLVQADVDGDGIADLLIQLTARVVVDVSDFVL